VGYLRPVDQWNEGKQAEFADRRTFDRQLADRQLDVQVDHRQPDVHETDVQAEQAALRR
jgi:hypothetical protein